MLGSRGRRCVSGPEVQRRRWQTRIECGIALAHGDNGSPALGQRLHIRPKLESRQQASAHLPRDRVAHLYEPLGLTIDARIMGQIAPGT